MKFIPVPNVDIPSLAWCARIKKGSQSIKIEHGSDVCVADDWFIAGAWSGEFVDGDFSDAVSMCGTGGAIDGDCAYFDTSTARMDRLFVTSMDDCAWISNSLAYAMVCSKDEPDPAFLTYAGLIEDMAIGGIYRESRFVPLKRDGYLSWEHCRIRVASDLSIQPYPKPCQTLPTSYSGYVELLTENIRQVIANATDSARHHRYEPILQVSRGLDSTALSVIAAKCGAKDSLSYYLRGESGESHVDDGSENARQLGYRAVSLLKSRAIHDTESSFPEATFCMVPPGHDVPIFNTRDHLRGRLRMTGCHGDMMFEGSNNFDVDDLKIPRYPRVSTGQTCADEFRLDINCLYYAPFYLGWHDYRKLVQISRSPEMKPWWSSGGYNKPIPRRIVQEAGIEDQQLQKRKMGTQYLLPKKLAHLNAHSKADYRQFVERLISATPALASVERHPNDPAFLFHWGFHHTRKRYLGTSLYR